TPPEKHCQNAIEWAGSTRYIFIEKPFDANPEAIVELKERLKDLKTKVFGFDHYAARLKPFLTEEKLKYFGVDKCTRFVFEMLEAAPRGLEERTPSIKDTGMLFDMASHALPILSWLTDDLTQAGRFSKLLTGTLLSPANRPYIRSETFSRLYFEFTSSQAMGGQRVLAEIIVGKGVGATDRKVVTLIDDKDYKLELDQWFMLARGKE